MRVGTKGDVSMEVLFCSSVEEVKEWIESVFVSAFLISLLIISSSCSESNGYFSGSYVVC